MFGQRRGIQSTLGPQSVTAGCHAMSHLTWMGQREFMKTRLVYSTIEERLCVAIQRDSFTLAVDKNTSRSTFVCKNVPHGLTNSLSNSIGLKSGNAIL